MSQNTEKKTCKSCGKRQFAKANQYYTQTLDGIDSQVFLCKYCGWEEITRTPA